MDLISVLQTVWRYKRFTIPVLVLTLLGAVYVDKIKPPVYDAASSVLFTNPPSQATKAQIAANPNLKNANSYNTFVAYGNLQVVANTVMDLVTSPSSQPALLAAGVSPNYQMTLSTDYGNPPIINITGVGSSPQAAINSAKVLTNAVVTDLYQIQKNQGVDPFYMITVDNFVKPLRAQHSSSGKLRSLVAVLAGGIILLFVVVSVADALAKRRKATYRNNDDVPAGGRRAARFQPEPVNSEPASTNNSASVPWGTGGAAAWRPDEGGAGQRPREYPTAPRYPRG